MKIKKIVDICRKSGQIRILNGEGMQWLGDGAAFYPLEDAPLFDEDSLCATFDITDKQKEGILFKVETELPENFCFESSCEGEDYAERSDISITYKGDDLHIYHSAKGALYMKAKYLRPLSSENIEIFLRETKDGVPYFVCKMGFMIQALIMPVMMERYSKEFVQALDLLHEQSLRGRK